MLAFWLQYMFMIRMNKIILILNDSELAFENSMNIQVGFFTLLQCCSSHYLDHFMSGVSRVHTE